MGVGMNEENPFYSAKGAFTPNQFGLINNSGLLSCQSNWCGQTRQTEMAWKGGFLSASKWTLVFVVCDVKANKPTTWFQNSKYGILAGF